MQQLARYLFELGQLKREPRSGWSLAGIHHPESVAEHSQRTAAIAFVLAGLEGADPYRAAALGVFHDAGETRVGDAHRLAKRYVDWTDAESRVVADQIAGLPSAVSARLEELHAEIAAKTSREARIAKDADRIECLLQACEYRAAGFDTSEWIESATRELVTESARRLAEAIASESPFGWRGDTGHGDTGHGDTGHGDTGHGDTGHGDTGHGDTGHGDTGR